MKPSRLRDARKQLRLVAVLAGLAVATTGCAIDGGQLVTDVVEAGLNSVTTSLVNALSEQLARD